MSLNTNQVFVYSSTARIISRGLYTFDLGMLKRINWLHNHGFLFWRQGFELLSEHYCRHDVFVWLIHAKAQTSNEFDYFGEIDIMCRVIWPWNIQSMRGRECDTKVNMDLLHWNIKSQVISHLAIDKQILYYPAGKTDLWHFAYA